MRWFDSSKGFKHETCFVMIGLRQALIFNKAFRNFLLSKINYILPQQLKIRSLSCDN